MLAALALLSGCPSKGRQEARAPSPAAPNLDPWVLTTTDLNVARGNRGIFLGNGRLGATFGAAGDAGKDGVAYTAGHYDAAETLLQDTRPWHRLGTATPLGDTTQSLDMKRGVLVTRTGTAATTAFLSAVDPDLYALQTTAAGQDKPTFSTHAEIGSRWTGFEAARTAHEAAWQALWKGRDIVIDGDPEAQQLVHKLMFDLLQSTRVGGDDSIAPETLSGDFYKGHIFWDAEIWMFPALLAQFPERARNILDYRYRLRDAARAQAAAKGYRGLDFPWESAKTGKETAPGGFSEGRHVTAGVGWAHWQYFLATGDKKWLAERGWPILAGVADYFASRANKNASGRFSIAGVTGPDEFAMNVTDNAYTNAMAANCLRAAGAAARVLGRPANPAWDAVARGLVLPFDPVRGAYLKMSGDDGKTRTKQADGELLLYPAQAPMDLKTAAATFDLHKPRVIKNGPAMSQSIHALIAARLGRADEADTAFRESYRPFVRGPFLLFSEKRSLDRCVFATGAGGVLQAVIYGFGGLDLSRPDGLVPGKPALPKGWTKLTVQGIVWKGRRYTLTVTPTKRTLLPQPS
jgi:trehalose/maltose hydrolase-like predicted phosphorylase